MPIVLSMPVLSLKKDQSTNGGGDARELLIFRLQFSAFDRLRPNGLGVLNGLGGPDGLGVPNGLGLPDVLG